MERECSQQIFEEYSNTKFHENPSTRIGSRVLTWGQTDVTKLTLAFRKLRTRQFVCISLRTATVALYSSDWCF
jgi:hypothetical protein